MILPPEAGLFIVIDVLPPPSIQLLQVIVPAPVLVSPTRYTPFNVLAPATEMLAALVIAPVRRLVHMAVSAVHAQEKTPLMVSVDPVLNVTLLAFAPRVKLTKVVFAAEVGFSKI